MTFEYEGNCKGLRRVDRGYLCPLLALEKLGCFDYAIESEGAVSAHRRKGAQTQVALLSRFLVARTGLRDRASDWLGHEQPSIYKIA